MLWQQGIRGKVGIDGFTAVIPVTFALKHDRDAGSFCVNFNDADGMNCIHCDSICDSQIE